MKRLVFILLLISSSIFIQAQDFRPHRIHRFNHNFFFFTGSKVFQLESYFAFESKPPQFTTTVPSLFIRCGIIDQLELNLEADVTSVYNKNLFEGHTGIAPLQPGMKIRINKPKLYIPSFALTAAVVIPKAATEKLQQTYWAPTLLLGAEQDVTKQLSLEYTGGVQWDADNFHRIYIASLNAEYDFTDNTSIYGDFFVMKAAHEKSDLHADVGVNQFVTSKARLDLSAGVGFTSAAPEYFFKGGLQFMLSAKQPKK